MHPVKRPYLSPLKTTPKNIEHILCPGVITPVFHIVPFTNIHIFMFLLLAYLLYFQTLMSIPGMCHTKRYTLCIILSPPQDELPLQVSKPR